MVIWGKRAWGRAIVHYKSVTQITKRVLRVERNFKCCQLESKQNGTVKEMRVDFLTRKHFGLGGKREIN